MPLNSTLYNLSRIKLILTKQFYSLYSKIPFITRTVYNANLLITRILVSPLFVIYLIKWSAYSAGLHTARILLIPDSARYKGSTTVVGESMTIRGGQNMQSLIYHQAE